VINTKDGGELCKHQCLKFTGDNCFWEGYNGFRGVEGANKIKIIESSKQIANCFINELT